MYKVKVDEYGNILTQYRSPEVLPAHNTIVDGYLWLESANVMEVKESYWNGTAFTARTPPPTKWHVWEGAWVESSGLKGVVCGQVMLRLKHLRDIKLQMSDWTQVVDAPLTSAKRAEWAAYRQDLRDLPSRSVGLTDLDLVAWPEKP